MRLTESPIESLEQTPIGLLPKEWEATELGRMVRIQKSTLDPRKFSEETFELYSMPAFEKNQRPEVVKGAEVGSNKLLIENRTLLFSKLNPRIPRIWLVQSESPLRKIASTDFIPLKANPSYSIEFVSYLTQSNLLYDASQMLTTGSTPSRQRVDEDSFLDLIVPSPRRWEQEYIAVVLNWFDTLIKNKIKQNEILDNIACAIFKNWFVDFWPFKDSEFVQIKGDKVPKNWDVKNIGSLAELVGGFAYAGSEKFEHPIEGSHLFITLNNIVQGGGFKTAYFWVKSDNLKDENYVDEDDLVMTNIHFGVGGLGSGRLFATPALVVFPSDYEKQQAVYSMDLTRLCIFNNELKYFLYLYLRFTREESVGFSTGTSILHLDEEGFKSNKLVAIPPPPFLRKFNSIAHPLFRKISANQKQIMTLRRARETMLALLVFGKVKIVDDNHGPTQ